MRRPRRAAATAAALFVVLPCLVLLYAWTVQPFEETPPHRRLDDSNNELLRPTLWPVSISDMVGFALATVGLMLAAGGGIGGGGILLPIYILVLSFTPKHAIPLSNVTVFGGALANLMLNYTKRHPDANRPLIDWNLILIMEPLTLSGALMGANLNVWLPDVVILLALVLLLGLTAYKTFLKSLKLHRQEVQGWNSVKADDQTDNTSQNSDAEAPTVLMELARPHPLHRTQSEPSTTPPATVNRESSRRRSFGHGQDNGDAHSQAPDEPLVPSNDEPMVLVSMELETEQDNNVILVDSSTKSSPDLLLEKILVEESRPPLPSMAVVASLFLFVLLVNLLKGGGAWESPLGIDCGSLGFWLLQALIVVATLGVTLYGRSHLLALGRRKMEAGYTYLQTDIQWDERSTLLYPAFCTLAGIVAGLFGIGGGLVKAPLMLALGVHPAVAAATSATMILFTTLTATTCFVVFGMLVWDYGVVCFLIGFAATWIGQSIMNALLRRTGKTSYIAFCITGVVLISALAMTVEWVVALSSGVSHRNAGFCDDA